MYSQDDIAGAISAGAISADEADNLRRFIERSRGATHIDEEDVPLIGGFNDAFVSLAALITFVAVAWIAGVIAWPLAGAAVSAVAWVLAIHFTEKRKLALTSRLLLGAFLLGLYLTGALISGPLALTGADGPARSLVGALFAAVGGWFHWQRFRVPVTPAAAVAVGVVVCVSFTNAIAGTTGYFSTAVLLVLLLCGLATFAWAMRWDGSDRGRTTRRADVAFWLHLMAAPLIVHPIFWLTGLAKGSTDPVAGAVVILIYVALSMIALAIDRRSLLVSALAYVLWALGNMLREVGSLMATMAFTALVIGSALLLLSAFWAQARRAIFALLPPHWQDRLPLLDRATDRVRPARQS